MKPSRSTDSFHWDIWLLMTVQNWVFDFGRPIAAVSSNCNAPMESIFADFVAHAANINIPPQKLVMCKDMNQLTCVMKQTSHS